MLAGLLVLVGLGPRVHRQAIEIGPLPVRRFGRSRGLGDQGLQALLVARVAEIVQFIKIQRGDDALQVLLDPGDAGLGGALHHARHDDRGQDAEDDYDDEDLDQGEAAGAAGNGEWGMGNRQKRR